MTEEDGQEMKEELEGRGKVEGRTSRKEEREKERREGE